MASGWTVPAGLRLLLDDIIHAVLDDNTSRLTTMQIYRLIADIVDTWIDQRTRLELGIPRQRDSDQPRKRSTTD